MAKLTDIELAARAQRDHYATRYPLTTWGIVMRIGLCLLWFSSIVYKIIAGAGPSWWTVGFAVVFTVVTREVYDGVRRRRYDRWELEQTLKNKEEV